MVSIPDPAGPWFAGIDSPNYTMHPNVLYDAVMPRVSPAEWKVVCLVVRLTTGWHVEMADITIEEIVKGTSLSRSGVKVSVASLIRQGVLISKRNAAPNGGSMPTTYGIRHDGGGQPVAPGRSVSGQGRGHTVTTFPIEERNPVKETILTDGKDNDPAALWSAALDQLRGEMTASNYRTWLEGSTGLRLDNGALVVQACAGQVEALETRFAPLVKRALAGRAVRFVRPAP